MNFLAEVLTTAREAQLQNVKKDIPEIVYQIDKLKCEVKNYMTNSHIDFKLMKKKSNDFLDEANKLNNKMTELNSQIEQITKKEIDDSTNELINLTDDLKIAIYALTLVNQLVNIEELLNGARQFLNTKQYLKAIVNINSIKQILKDIPTDECLNIIQVISISVTIEHGTILNESKKVWNESIITDRKVVDDEINLSIKINNSRSDEVQQSMQALGCENPFIFECLGKFLMNEIFFSIINYNCTVDVIEDRLFSMLIAKVNKKSKKMSYDQVFNNIRTVIDYLVATINFGIKTDMLLLGFIGQKISNQFCEQLIKNCLADTVPSTPEGLKKYNIVTKDVESLQKQLIECQFFNEENLSILEYANNVHVLFANKTCQAYLDKARIILKKDLHDMIEVGTEVNPAEGSNNVNIFEKCYVSRNVNEYLDLVRKILDQANTSSEMCAGRLVLTANQIIGFYYELIPEYHKKLLDTIPQQVALFHNNCIYIAHELLTLNKYQQDKKANPVLREQLFANHFQLLRTRGTKIFDNYMKSQVKQLQEILQESEFNKLGQTDKIDPTCEKSIRQCLRQLELLKTVWQKVLTYEIYNKSTGELLNSFVEFLIKLVIGVEDISADNCTLLVEVYGIVKNRAPKLFTEPKEINLYVKRWYKFNELILLLNSNLTDINDRWADGKGPLAVEFTANEVKGLIKALFQNTERRATVLAKIS